MVKILYPTLGQLYYVGSKNGGELEGREHRVGWQSMHESTYARKLTISNYRPSQIAINEVPGRAIDQGTFEVEIETFPPLSLLGIFGVEDVLRLEAVANWLWSFQEVLRHEANAPMFVNSEIWPVFWSILWEESENLINLMDGYLKGCVDKGKWDREQWQYYVKEHAKSASPFVSDNEEMSVKWYKILESNRDLDISLDQTYKFVDNFDVHWKEWLGNDKRFVYINTVLAYPGIRSRVGKYILIKMLEYIIHVMVQKWRVRKVGGIPGISQEEAGVYHRKEKKEIIKPFYRWAERLLNMQEGTLHSLAVEGVSVFVFLAELVKKGEKVYCYDEKTAEKQTGLGVERYFRCSRHGC